MLFHRSHSLRRHVLGAASIAIISLVAACTGDDSASSDAGKDGTASDAAADVAPVTCAMPGAPTPGAADTHCAGVDGGAPIVQPTSAASCHPTGGGDAAVQACPYGDTIFGLEADDDDCKYHIKWSSTALCEGGDGVKLTLIVTNKSDQSPLVAGNMNAEVFTTSPPNDAGCDNQSTHPGPNSGVILTEGPQGTYTGLVKFDAPGQWTVRFHIHEECADLNADSPHGHAAFHLTLP